MLQTAEYLLFPAALSVLGHEYRSSNSVRQPFRWLNRRCRRWCSHRYAARIAVAVGAFLAGMGLGGGRSGLAADACLCGEGSARPAQVGEHSEDAPVGVGAPVLRFSVALLRIPGFSPDSITEIGSAANSVITVSDLAGLGWDPLVV